ncbi:integrase [Candidatus Marinamargulisbacteria bacterium SCGC AAA071-K20]|nr:integrase [Candidatus Marinamargulisbacteria bacterium SCGC AAA071-K20]
MNVIQFRDTLKKLGKSPATINNRLSALSSLFSHLIEKQVLQINPVLGVKRLKDEYHLVKSKCINTQDVSKLLKMPESDSLIGIRDKAILSIFFYTGTRVGALTKLKMKDFFEDSNYTVLDFQIKGGRRNRVALHPQVQADIKEWLVVREHSHVPDAPLFYSFARNGNAIPTSISTRGVSKIWSKYKVLVGIEGISPHSARTTFITTSLENGADINDVKETAGHLSIRTTQSYYYRKKTYERSASFSVRY